MNELELEALMAEPPGGHNHGRKATAATSSDIPVGRKVELGQDARRSFLREGGWVRDDTLRPLDGESRWTGGRTHRGVLDEVEYVDEEKLAGLVRDNLGVSPNIVNLLYRPGYLAPHEKAVRDAIDKKFLALADAGGNMLALARVLGWPIEGPNAQGKYRSKKMERALARAREARDS